jgi:hypothetical protein
MTIQPDDLHAQSYPDFCRKGPGKTGASASSTIADG